MILVGSWIDIKRGMNSVAVLETKPRHGRRGTHPPQFTLNENNKKAVLLINKKIMAYGMSSFGFQNKPILADLDVVTCSVCLEVFNKPMSISCGHMLVFYTLIF